MREVKFKVVDKKGNLQGYETWDITFGWTHTLAYDEVMKDGTPPVHSGTLPDGINNFIRFEYAGEKDFDKKDIYEGDTVEIAFDEAFSLYGRDIKGIVKFIEGGFYVDTEKELIKVWQEILFWKIVKSSEI